MQGIVLNEDGYVTSPAEIFKCIEDEGKPLNWRVSNVECGGAGSDNSFPFKNGRDMFIEGEELFNMLMEHSEMQWWWGILSGFPSDVEWDEIRKKPVIDIQMETSYLDKEIRHIEPGALIEIVAFDSTETYVLADSEDVIKKLQNKYPRWESLDKYVSRRCRLTI